MPANWMLDAGVALVVAFLAMLLVLGRLLRRAKAHQARLERLDQEITDCFRRLQDDFHARLVELHAQAAAGEARLAELHAGMQSVRKEFGVEMSEWRLHYNSEQRELRSLLNELLRVRAA